MFRVSSAVLTAILIVAPVAADPPPLPRPKPLGQVCGDQALVGTPLPAIEGDGGCGIAAPVQLSVAAGVILEPPATITCETGRALADWLRSDPESSFGQRLEAISVVDAYSCRNRNRATGGELSEHASGRAIDISAFRLSDGTTVTVRDGWTAPRWSTALRQIHDAGCGPFGTVLGPDANPLHADHLHLDLAERRSGPYCK